MIELLRITSRSQNEIDTVCRIFQDEFPIIHKEIEFVKDNIMTGHTIIIEKKSTGLPLHSIEFGMILADSDHEAVSNAEVAEFMQS